MRHVLTIVVLLAVAAVWVPTAFADEAVDLRPQWRDGQTSRYQFWTTRTQAMTMTAGGQTRSAESVVETEGEVTWRVERRRADGGFTCTMTLDWMTATLIGPDGQRVRNDSRRGTGEAESVHALIRAMAGVPLTIEVAPDGRITRASNVEAMQRRFTAGDFPIEPLDFIETATDLAVLAGAPAELRPNGTWRMDFRWTHELGHINHDTTFRLAGVEQIEGVPIATVTTTARKRLDIDRDKLPPTQPGGPQVDVRMTASDHQGQVMFDLLRREAVGRNSIDSRTIQTTIRLPNATINQQLVETVQSQALRIEER
jgi:hypothetical protein